MHLDAMLFLENRQQGTFSSPEFSVLVVVDRRMSRASEGCVGGEGRQSSRLCQRVANFMSGVSLSVVSPALPPYMHRYCIWFGSGRPVQ
jgi:hypothetical protein